MKAVGDARRPAQDRPALADEPEDAQRDEHEHDLGEPVGLADRARQAPLDDVAGQASSTPVRNAASAAWAKPP